MLKTATRLIHRPERSQLLAIRFDHRECRHTPVSERLHKHLLRASARTGIKLPLLRDTLQFKTRDTQLFLDNFFHFKRRREKWLNTFFTVDAHGHFTVFIPIVFSQKKTKGAKERPPPLLCGANLIKTVFEIQVTQGLVECVVYVTCVITDIVLVTAHFLIFIRQILLAYL